MTRKQWGAICLLLLAGIVYMFITLHTDAQGSTLKYSRVYGEWRYCYYFNGAVITVEKRLSCPRYAL